MTSALFLLCTVASVACAVALVTRKNPIYSAFFMMGLFVSISVLYALLAAPFLATMQLLVYAGAILVLFLFVIMLFNLSPEEMGKEPGGKVKALAGGICALLFALMVAAISRVKTSSFPEAPADIGSAKWVGAAIFRDFVLPFEVVSILILVAVLGAVVLAKKKL